MNHYINNLIYNVNLSLLSFKNISYDFILLIKNKYTALSFLNPFLNYIENNLFFLFFFIFFICFFFSNLILNFFFLLLVLDSFFSSFFVLLNISSKIYSSRLSTNTLTLIMLYLNPLNPFITIILSFILYSKYNEIIKKFIMNAIKIFMLYLFANINILKNIYPDYKLISNMKIKIKN